MCFKSNSSKFGDYVQAFGPQLNILYHVVLVRNFKKENLEILFFFLYKIVTSHAYIKALVKIIFGRNFFICQPIFKICATLFMTFRMQNVCKI